jgi:glutamate-ammonia-ligase adenylyltransferase
VKILQERTADGYVFRTEDGPAPAARSGRHGGRHLHPGGAALLREIGQNWERAAMIKARPCAGDIAAGEAFLKELAAVRLAQAISTSRRSPTSTR